MVKKLVLDSRSYRSFDETKILDENELLELVDTARLVPSASNRQPLKYKICTAKAEVEKVLSLPHGQVFFPISPFHLRDIIPPRLL